MKRFRFQLQTALEWRKQRMDADRARLDELLGIHRQLGLALETVERNWKESQESLVKSAAITATELAALESYRRAVANQKTRIQRETVRAGEMIEQQRQVVMAATRDFRLLEKLKERRMEEWRKASEKDIESEAGELYLAQLKPEPDK